VAILLISFAFKIQDPNKRLMAIVAVSSVPASVVSSELILDDGDEQMISLGCALGEIPCGAVNQ
jgi:hypothetical protein